MNSKQASLMSIDVDLMAREEKQAVILMRNIFKAAHHDDAMRRARRRCLRVPCCSRLMHLLLPRGACCY
jgi:hypothetical protein